MLLLGLFSIPSRTISRPTASIPCSLLNILLNNRLTSILLWLVRMRAPLSIWSFPSLLVWVWTAPLPYLTNPISRRMDILNPLFRDLYNVLFNQKILSLGLRFVSFVVVSCVFSFIGFVVCYFFQSDVRLLLSFLFGIECPFSLLLFLKRKKKKNISFCFVSNKQ